jgi:hypothetical protein
MSDRDVKTPQVIAGVIVSHYSPRFAFIREKILALESLYKKSQKYFKTVAR